MSIGPDNKIMVFAIARSDIPGCAPGAAYSDRYV